MIEVVPAQGSVFEQSQSSNAQPSVWATKNVACWQGRLLISPFPSVPHEQVRLLTAGASTPG